MEIELKWGLRHPGDLQHLLAHLPEPERILLQQNHYYTDDAGELASAKTMVRFREEGLGGEGCSGVQRVVLTVKKRLSKVDGVFRAEEVEEVIPADVWKDILFERKTLDELESPALETLRRNGSIGAWVPQGVLTNKRHVVHLEGFVLEVDRTTFDDGHVDVEVEVETVDTAGAERLLTRLGTEAGIDFFVQTHGKYSRFRKRSLSL
jgi:adenylate cyclase class IV